MSDFIEMYVLPILFIFVVFICLIFIIKDFDNKQIEKIDALVNRNDLAVYENCWKLEGKYYCKD